MQHNWKLYIFLLGIFAYYHSGIYTLAGADKELASFLSTEESVRDGCAGR